MKFLIRKGLTVYSALFALLLLIQTALFIMKGTSTSQNAVIELASVEGTSQFAEETDHSVTLLILQVLLVTAGLPLLFLLLRRSHNVDQRLTLVTNGLLDNSTKFVFNSGEKLNAQGPESVQAHLISNLKKVRDFVTSISDGNDNITWEGFNDQNKDLNRETIAGALLHMRDQMQRVKEEDKIRIWTTEGLSKFSEIIRTHQDDFEKLSQTLISNVVKYAGAKVGGLFILEEEEGTNQSCLMLRACYAYERKKHLTKKVEIGEGVIGQCYLEGETVYLAKVPNNYLSITSGLGDANPSSLLVIPLKTNDKIEGVLELASLKPFDAHEINFLEKLGELLASSIVTVRTGEKTARLLQISQEQAEEMRAQEEEMRQNMEELEATQEQMNRTMSELASLRDNLEKEKYLLDALMDNIPDAIYFKDRESKFIRVSKYLAGHFSGNVNDLIGKSDFDFQDKARAQQAFDDEMNIMSTRQPKIDYIEKEVMTDGSEHWVSTTKMPLINAKSEVVGTFGISRDVTRLKKLENDVDNRDKNLNAEKKRYEDKIKSLEDQLNS